MVKRKQLDKKKRNTVRERQWEQNHETAFSHDLARHRRALVKMPEHSGYHDRLPVCDTPNATLVSHSRKWAFVKLDEGAQVATPTDAGSALCLIDERIRQEQETLLAPGDRVLVEDESDHLVVRGIAPRTTTLTRYTAEKGPLGRQLIAANVDVLVIVAAAANPPFRPGLIDRFLITAQLGGATPIVCVNKMDLVPREPEECALYRTLGISLYPTSCATGMGLETLRDALRNKTSVLAGHSGVGKSSILNCLDPGLRVFTREVSEATQRGRHATSASRLYELRGAIRIIDTPGIRAMGLWDVSPDEVAYYFPEIAEHGVHCRFRNCTHIHEPLCAVRDAVDAGAITRERYASYKRIRECLESD